LPTTTLAMLGGCRAPAPANGGCLLSTADVHDLPAPELPRTALGGMCNLPSLADLRVLRGNASGDSARGAATITASHGRSATESAALGGGGGDGSEVGLVPIVESPTATRTEYGSAHG
jgi:hypothetical protein